MSGEVVDGEALGQQEFAAEYDAPFAEAEAARDVAGAVTLRSFGCADEGFGGTFPVQENLSLDLSAGVDADADTLPSGTWEIAAGAEAFAEVAGSGDHAVDFATSESVYSG